MPTDGIVHVIDDDEAMRESLAFLLKSAKVPVATYDSATRIPRQAAQDQRPVAS